ncbi:hypothetical protein FACS1894216_18340 [Synergistales bacterium]|nr:hypothetical protein FACS1894216_18340 [Synergistales bacterium]
MGKIMVVTFAYNAEKTIERAVHSILSQSYGNWEYHLFNNGSQDDTQKIISRLCDSDSRIISHEIEENTLLAGGIYVPDVLKATDCEWFCWIDADDEYKPDFFIKMLDFVKSNRLDAAACGYDRIDGFTGKLIKRKSNDGNIFLLERQDFLDKFIQYRGFTIGLWGKFISIPVMADILDPQRVLDKWENFSDTQITLKSFRLAKRVGIYGEALYKYYIYPKSLSNSLVVGRYEMDMSYYRALRSYLLYYGEISKLNEDFLCAVLLSLLDETVPMVFNSELAVVDKLEILSKIFNDANVAEMFNREADPQFHNLAGRSDFLNNVMDRLSAQAREFSAVQADAAKLAEILKRLQDGHYNDK